MADITTLEEYILETNKKSNNLVGGLTRLTDDVTDLSANISNKFSENNSQNELTISRNSEILLSNSDIVDHLSTISDYTKDIRVFLGDIVGILGKQTKDIFFKERQREQDVQIQIERNELLEQQKDLLEEGIDSEGEGGSSGLFGMLAGGLAGLFGGNGIGGLAAGGLTFLKGGAKLIGKIALPLAMIAGVIDFIQGFANAKEITGRDGFIAKIQAGVASIVSGLTFGFVSPETISNGIDWIFEQMVSVFTGTFDLIKRIVAEYNLVGLLDQRIEQLSFGLFNLDDIITVFNKVKDKIISLFTAPFNLIKNLYNGESLSDSINEYFDSVTFGLWDLDSINETYQNIKNKIKDFFKKPIDFIRGLFKKDNTDTIDNLQSNKKDPNKLKNQIRVDEELFVSKHKPINIQPTQKQNELLNETQKEATRNKKEKIIKKEETTNNVSSAVINNTYQNNTDMSVDTDDFVYKKIAYSF